jgi:hypothetical protein
VTFAVNGGRVIPPAHEGTMEPETKSELRSRMKRVLTEFAALESFNEDEEEARANLEKEMRQVAHSWEFLCGMAEGVNIVTRMHPFAVQDVTFRLVARLVMVCISKLGLEAIQEVEDGESFPEEL